MDEFRSGGMFCLVCFKGGRRRRTLVPDTWLSVNDTLCLLPPNASDSDLDALVRNLAEPGEGWQMFEVSSLQTFESYKEAKKQLEKSQETSQSGTSSKRKRKKPSRPVDYATHDSDDSRTPYTVFGVDFDEDAMSENEWIPPPEFSPRIENVSTVKNMIRNDHRRKNDRFSQSRLSSHMKNIHIPCDCQSSCHGAFLKTLHAVQKQLDRNNQMVQKLLGGQRQTHSQLKRVLRDVPVNQMNDPEEMDVSSQDSSNFGQSEENAGLKKKNDKLIDMNIILQTKLISLLSANGSLKLNPPPTQKIPESVGTVTNNLPKGIVEGGSLRRNPPPTPELPESDGGVVNNLPKEIVETNVEDDPSICDSPEKELYLHDNGSVMRWKDDQMELAPGVSVTKEEWDKIVAGKNMNPSRVARNLAVTLWGAETLRERSVTGAACRRYLKDGIEAKKALSPIKVDAVQNGLRLWLTKYQGKEKEEVLKLSSLTAVRKLLADKIMDLSKHKKVMDLLKNKNKD